MKNILIIMVIVLSLFGCKKKVEYEQEQRAQQAVQQSDAEVVWKITTPGATYNGHKLELDSRYASFVTDDNKKVYVFGTYQIETQGK